ncbi:MAG: NAD(P)-dependent oxidoreductase [Candidatus Competibacterales bacterium]|nr:NAD(P)-dependent oxidoreductase [Candidatus Competibacterales bacterium]
MSQSRKVAFVGLGVMGYPMAGHLAAAGHDVSVYNRTTARAERWTGQHDGTARPTPREAAAGNDFVMLCVGNDDDLRAVVYGDDGVLAGLETGATLIDHTTASAEVARELDAVCRERGLAFLDAPVSGGQAGAENGALTVMVGGDSAAFEAARPLMDCYARAVTRMGEAGAGQLTKMVNQIAIAGLLQSLSEALNFSERAGLDSARVLDVISQGAAGSWQMENRGHTMLRGEFDFGFAVEWMRKDLAICLAEARRNGARLPVAALVDQFYAQVQARGGSRWDTSSLIQLLARD